MQAAKPSLLWVRVAGIAVSALALYFVFRRLNPGNLIETFRTMRPGWFIAGITVYGLLFVPAVIRWHLVLRMMGFAVGPGPTARAYLAGHFFYVLLFGAAGGDSARSLYYARWHQYSAAGVLATAPLDRLLGAMGLAVFAVLALMLQIAAGGFGNLRNLKLHVPWWWAGVLLTLGLLIWLSWRSRAESFGRRFVETLRQGARTFLQCPRLVVAGILCGLLVQVALSAVLALNLEAVSHTPIPWRHLFWAFPVVALTGALPVTAAGLGAREGAALVLLGLYGISSATAVAASLLTASASVMWAGLGAILWWNEARASRKRRLANVAAQVGR